MNELAKSPDDVAKVTVSLYEKRRKIYAKAVSGHFANWRIALVLLTQRI